jgi:hypothetical protein
VARPLLFVCLLPPNFILARRVRPQSVGVVMDILGTRFGVVLLVIMGMLAGVAPRAHAAVESELAIQGSMLLNNGVAYPCLSGKDALLPNLPTVDPQKCTSKIGNSTSFTFLGSAIESTAKVRKEKCDDTLDILACVQIATSSISAAGLFSGWCGLSIGVGSGTIAKKADIVDNKRSSPSLYFWFTWEELGGIMMVTGQATRANIGPGIVLGTLFMAQVPGDLISFGSCFNKASKLVTLAGPLTILWSNMP